MKSVEFFKATVPYFESNLKVIYFPKKERVNFHELYSRTKKFFGTYVLTGGPLKTRLKN